MRKDDHIRVRHAIDAARKAIFYASTATREELDRDEKLAFTLIHLLEIVGEAGNQVSPAFQQAHPEVPWRNAIALRHRPSHGYLDVNLDTIWKVVREHLPGLAKTLEATVVTQTTGEGEP